MRWQVRREVFRGEKQFTLKIMSPNGEMIESLTFDVDDEGYFDIEPHQQSAQLGVFAIKRGAPC